MSTQTDMAKATILREWHNGANDRAYSADDLQTLTFDERNGGVLVEDDENTIRVFFRDGAEIDLPKAIVPLGMTATPLQHYTVDADAETGEWLGEPQATGETVLANEWSARRDTGAEHYDTYEHGDPGQGTQETRAITVRHVP